MFIIFVNDLLGQFSGVVTKTWNDLKPPKTTYNHLQPPTTTSKNSTVDTYADDTTLSASAAVSDLPAVQQRLQEDINRIANWTSENRMVLNKTKTLLVTGKRLEKKIPDKALEIACNGSEIGQVSGKSLHRSYLG